MGGEGRGGRLLDWGFLYKLTIAVGALITHEAFFRGGANPYGSIESFKVIVSFATEVDRRSIKTCLAQNFNLPIFLEILVCLSFPNHLV